MRARLLAIAAGLSLSLTGAAGWIVATAMPAAALNLVVTTTTDDATGTTTDCTDAEPSSNTPCSLRDAFAAASLAGDDTITLGSSLTYGLDNGELLHGGSGGNLTIVGQGSTIDSNTAGARVIHNLGGALQVTDLTITGGTKTGANPDGGGIFQDSGGALTLVNSTVTGNSAGEDGGGIALGGALTLTNSAVTGNTADTGSGGGLYSGGGAAWSITDSTISGNIATAGSGGGLSMGAGGSTPSVTLTRSTVSGNNAAVGGAGGIFTIGQPITLKNSTVHNNSGGLQTGGMVGGAITLVYSTITDNAATQINAATLSSFASVVGGTATTNCVQGGGTSSGRNFEQNTNTCGFTNSGSDDTNSGGDPMLGSLQNNGGPTQTRKPANTSPLVGKVPAASCQADGATGITTDQRGAARPAVPDCDTGSVEIGGTIFGLVNDLLPPPPGRGTGMPYPAPASVKVRICPNAEPFCTLPTAIVADVSPTTGAYTQLIEPGDYQVAAFYCKTATGCVPGGAAANTGPNQAATVADGTNVNKNFAIGFRPDVQAAVSSSPMVITGANTYAPPGAVQTRSAGVKPGASIKFLVTLSNDGNLTDKILLKATVSGSASLFKILFTEGPYAISNIATTGRMYTLNDTTKVVAVTITPKAGTPVLSSVTVEFKATSQNQGAGAKADSVKVKAIRN